ncbi:MAG: N-acyl homoserine lactonase family protein [Acidimicrobiia bacterium]
MTFTITPLVVAYGPHREKSRFTYMHYAGETIDLPYVSWLIEGEGIRALVDVGCSATDYVEHIRPADRPLVHVGQTFDDVQDVTTIEEHLAARGWTPDDIDMVILTHLDWDHCMSTRIFHKSKIILQRSEWDALPPHPLFKSGYCPPYIYEEIGDMDLDLVEGDKQLAEGLRLMLTPGHTPGGQSVVVDTRNGKFVIGGMCTIRENFYPPADLGDIEYKVIPPGGHVDVIGAYDSMIRMLDVGGDNVLPVHDLRAFDMGVVG